MTIVTKSIKRKGETLVMTNQRAVFWESHKTLILSDLHIGKAAHFRKHGIPIPVDVLHADLQRLEMLIQFFNCTSLTIVGDLFHAGANGEIEMFKEWKNKFEVLSIDLIKGNHDRLSNKMYDEIGLNVYKPVKHVPPITFIHDTNPDETNKFCISGHTHPGVTIKLSGKQYIKLPCYQLSNNQMVLPAFSDFTGLNTKSCKDDAICYAFTDSAIFAVK
ncbi:putative phosphoesterase [Flavobacteriaceae bacterium MAR_2010_188]|nr:putative phosphoesterase [Flavobacteriaceae bacterium MAR_2010_188]